MGNMRRNPGHFTAIVLVLFATPAIASTSDPTLLPPNPLPFEYSEGQSAPRREVRDPCIVHEGGTYYLVFTMWPFRGHEEKHLASRTRADRWVTEIARKSRILPLA